MALPRILPEGERGPDRRAEPLAVIADPVTRETVRAVAAQLGWPQNRIREGGLSAACALLQTQAQAAPGVLLVDVSDAADVLAGMDALAEVCEPHTSVVAVGTANDVDLYRALIGLGISDYLVKPVSPVALAEALRKAERAGRAPVTAAPQQACRTVGLVGARGGVGATSLAVALGWSLAHEHERRTVLIDLDLQFGAAALSLDLEPGRGLRELLAHPDRIDSLLIGSAASQESPRLRVLAAEEPLDAEPALSGAGLEALLSAVTEGSDAVILDAPRRLDAPARAALAAADVAIVVTDLSLAGLRDSQRLLALLGGMRAEGEILVVANRVGGVAGEVPQAEFERGLGRKLDLVLPFDAKAAEAAAAQARALPAVAGQSALGAGLRALTRRVAGVDEAPAAGRAAWFKRVLGR